MKIGEKRPAPKIRFGENKKKFSILSLKKIKDVKAFYQGTNIPIKTREDLKEIVEEPCLKACQDLFDKNVQTLDSGCNGENCSDCAYIVINYDTLDEKNKKIADRMVANNLIKFIPKSDECIRNYFNQLFIKVLTSPEERIIDVERKLAKITHFFVPQHKIVKNIDYNEVRAMQQKYMDRMYGKR